MTNIKATKRALGSSVLALFLCFAMLLGTTFAWFTDSVTSANNVITAGNLDVELEYWNGKEWVDVSGKSDILTNELWEPGTTEVAYLRVANAGSLALKYQLGINIVSEKAGTNKAGKSFLLSDYIQFGVVEGVNGEIDAYANRNAAVEAVKEAKKISAGYTKKNTLYSATNIPADIVGATSEEYIALVVYMPETVGDEANHNGDAPTINLGINVVATQVTGENDSYGPDYDANAPICNVIVESEEALKEALANAKNGDVIGISGNVTWTTGASIGSTPFVDPVATVDDDAKDPLTYITLVGVGEDATFTAIGAGVGAIGIDNGTVIFKNLTIVDESVSYAENSWEYGYLEFRGNTVFENCEIVNAIMMEGKSATFKNCSFNSYDDNQYAVWVSDGEVSFENCYITGARGIKVHEAYGSEVKSVVINNNRFENLTKKPGLAIGTVNADTTITITNNIFAGTQAGDQDLYSYETDTDVTTFKFTYEGNTVAGYAANNEDLKNALANNATVVVPAGKYTFPASDFKANTTLICAEGTVFNGKTGLNINGATVVGATFTNDNDYLVNSTTINGTFKDCVFTDCDGLRYCYAGETVVFENCVFDTDFYGVHFDGGANDVLFKNCTFSGFNTFGSAVIKLTLENCTFKYNGKGGYNGINLWGDAELTKCTFVFDGSASNEWVDLCGDNKTVTFTDCVVTDGTTEKGIETVVGNYGVGNTIIIDGVHITPITNVAPAPYVGELYAEGSNVVEYKGLKLAGNSYISIDNNASVAIENVTADVNGSVIIMKDYQPAIYIYGGDFTIGEGEYLIDASAVNGGVYQIFLVNVTVNGEMLTQEIAAKYLNNVNWYQALIDTTN